MSKSNCTPEEFVAALRRGDRVLAHPDTLAELEAKAPVDLWFAVRLARSENRIISSGYAEPGMLYAWDEKGQSEYEERRLLGGRGSIHEYETMLSTNRFAQMYADLMVRATLRE